jgi:glycosyltransferase involved in cell wall biosynthesis
LKKSKIGILTSNNDITRQMGPACKLFEYMTCGLPVVANNIGGWTELIEREQIGLLTDDDPKDFANSIDRILSDDSLWQKMHSNALHIVKVKNNWQENARKLLIPLYSSLCH